MPRPVRIAFYIFAVATAFAGAMAYTTTWATLHKTVAIDFNFAAFGGPSRGIWKGALDN